MSQESSTSETLDVLLEEFKEINKLLDRMEASYKVIQLIRESHAHKIR